MEFTVKAKEVKLMAIHKGIRIHQYLDDPLSLSSAYTGTSKTVSKFRLVNLEKSELQLCRFLHRSQVRSGPTNAGPWHTLRQKLQELLSLLGPTICTSLEDPDLVHQETVNPQGLTHSRLVKCDSRQAIKTGSDHPNRVVSPSRGLPSVMQQVAPPSNRPICYEVQ